MLLYYIWYVAIDLCEGCSVKAGSGQLRGVKRARPSSILPFVQYSHQTGIGFLTFLHIDNIFVM